MQNRLVHVVALCSLAAAAAAAPALAQRGPMSTAFRANAIETARNLAAAAELMPDDKLGFKPTARQQSFGDLLAHAANANDYLCSILGGVAAPQRSKMNGGAPKPALIARLRETKSFCADALSHLDDATLGDELSFLGGKRTRAAIMVHAIADWESHYSQAAAYLRLNGKIPPTAK